MFDFYIDFTSVFFYYCHFNFSFRKIKLFCKTIFFLHCDLLHYQHLKYKDIYIQEYLEEREMIFFSFIALSYKFMHNIYLRYICQICFLLIKNIIAYIYIYARTWVHTYIHIYALKFNIHCFHFIIFSIIMNYYLFVLIP